MDLRGVRGELFRRWIEQRRIISQITAISREEVAAINERRDRGNGDKRRGDEGEGGEERDNRSDAKKREKQREREDRGSAL